MARMPVSLAGQLVVAISSRALFDFEAENQVFEAHDGTLADLDQVLAASDLMTNTEGTAPGCMSEPGDPECAALLPRLGVPSTTGQALFRVK